MASREHLLEHATAERKRFKEQEKAAKRQKKAAGSEDAGDAFSHKANLICQSRPADVEYVSDLLLPGSNASQDENSQDERLQGPRAKDGPAAAKGFDDERLPQDVFGRFAESKYGKGFTAPTDIQSLLWVCMLRGFDCIAVAPTGSGKTLAYSLPAICHVLSTRTESRRSPTCLILGPTRELVSQINETVRQVRKAVKGFEHAVFYGGDEKVDDDIPETIDILVSTPGRCLDLVAQSKKISLARTTLVVLDEADKMLQMGFVPDLRAILSYTPRNRQTTFVTATWTSQAEQTSTEWTRSEEIIKIQLDIVPEVVLNGAHEPLSLTVSSKVEQIVQVCAAHKKPRKLIRHIERLKKKDAEGKLDPMLVFCNKIKTVLFVYEFLARQNIKVCTIHGQMHQKDRERVLEEFKTGKNECLVATDVAGRGLHIPNLVHVVNYDFPTSLPQYAHRIGRCGRGKNGRGSSFSFFTRNLGVMAPDLVKLLQASKQQVDPNLATLADEIKRKQSSSNTEKLDALDEGNESEVKDQPSAGADSEPSVSDEGSRHGKSTDDIDDDDIDDGDDHDDDEDSLNELLDFVGAVPLMSFVPGAKTKKERSKSKKNHMKRPRGKRGGKKNRKKEHT